MATVNFLYRSTKSKSNLVLRLLFRDNGFDYVLGAKTQFEVDKDYWIKQHNLKRIKDIDISNKQSLKSGIFQLKGSKNKLTKVNPAV